MTSEVTKNQMYKTFLNILNHKFIPTNKTNPTKPGFLN